MARASASDASTVAEVVAGKIALKDKTVGLGGQVVKADKGIMGGDGVHVQDGSRPAGAGTHDVPVPATETATVGDIDELECAVHTDLKFGAGYEYAVLIEAATPE